jgi:hypothetical protein
MRVSGQRHAHILVSAGMKFRNKKVPVRYTGIYRPITNADLNRNKKKNYTVTTTSSVSQVLLSMTTGVHGNEIHHVTENEIYS